MNTTPLTINNAGKMRLFTLASVCCVLFVAYFAYCVRYYFSPEMTAEALMYDSVWGFQAVYPAKYHGDAVIRILETKLKKARSSRNCVWIDEVVSSSKTLRGIHLAERLAQEQDLTTKIIGLSALARMDRYKDISVLSEVCLRPTPNNLSADQLSICAVGLGHTKNRSAIRVLNSLLIMKRPQQTPCDRCQLEEAVCLALGEIGGVEAIAILKCCLRDKSFDASAEAFKSLRHLNSDEAIGLAIDRLYTKEGFKNERLLRLLQKETGQHIDYDSSAWSSWYTKSSFFGKS